MWRGLWCSSWILAGGPSPPRPPTRGPPPPWTPRSMAQLRPRMAQLRPPLWGLRPDLFKQRFKNLKNRSVSLFFHQGIQIGCKSRKTSFYVFCLFTALYRCFRPSRVLQTIDHEKIYRFVSKILNFMPYGSVLSRFSVFQQI